MFPVTKQLHGTLELIQLATRSGLTGKLQVDPPGNQCFLDPFGSPPGVIALSLGEQPGKTLVIDQIQSREPGEYGLRLG